VPVSAISLVPSLTGAREADDLDVLTQISDTDITLDSSLTVEQKDILSALLDPLADDDGVDLIGQEIAEPEDTFQGLSEVGFWGEGCWVAWGAGYSESCAFC
jgi:hypothetical protein